MKEFIEKLIERLKEIEVENSCYGCTYRTQCNVVQEKVSDETDLCGATIKEVAIEIVNQLAEEHKDDIQTIDVSELLGESEQGNDFCEWKFTKSVADGGYFYSSGCNHKRFSDLHSFEYCPYCGKKIKIAPYQPKGE